MSRRIRRLRRPGPSPSSPGAFWPQRPPRPRRWRRRRHDRRAAHGAVRRDVDDPRVRRGDRVLERLASHPAERRRPCPGANPRMLAGCVRTKVVERPMHPCHCPRSPPLTYPPIVVRRVALPHWPRPVAACLPGADDPTSTHQSSRGFMIHLVGGTRYVQHLPARTQRGRNRCSSSPRWRPCHRRFRPHIPCRAAAS